MWLFFFLPLAFSQEASVEEFCFSSPVRMQEVSLRLKSILLPIDQFSTSGNCFTVQTPARRRELIQSYVRRLDPDVSISFSSAELRRDPCRIKIERFRNNQSQQTEVGLNQTLNADQSKTSEVASETMQVQTLKEFELTYNQLLIKGECRYITPNRYEIQLEARKDPKPLLPPLPEGSTVIIQNSPKPENEQTSSLKTQLQLTRGERIEIGSVMKDETGQNHTIKINPSAAAGQSDSQSTEKVFLSLE